MLNVYKVMSSNIVTAIASNGELVTKQPVIKAMRVVKKEILELIAVWIQRSTNPQMVSSLHLYPHSDIFSFSTMCDHMPNRTKTCTTVIGTKRRPSITWK